MEKLFMHGHESFCFLPSAKGNVHAFKQIQTLGSLEKET